GLFRVFTAILDMRAPPSSGDPISIFFFSSRRRHTRFSRDWSSDVCSSDLSCTFMPLLPASVGRYMRLSLGICPALLAYSDSAARSEERRVGKECRPGWTPHN